MREINDDKRGERGQVARDGLLYKLCLNHKYASLKKADKGPTWERITGVCILSSSRVTAPELIIITVNPVVASCYIAFAVITT